jgi:hypothetical protein
MNTLQTRSRALQNRYFVSMSAEPRRFFSLLGALLARKNPLEAQSEHTPEPLLEPKHGKLAVLALSLWIACLMSLFAPPPARWSPEFLESARYLALDLQPRHARAQALVDALTAMVDAADHRRGNRRQAAGQTKLQHAVSGIVGGLLRAWSHKNGPLPVWHSNQAQAFTAKSAKPDTPAGEAEMLSPALADQAGEAGAAKRRVVVGRRSFKPVMEALTQAKLVAHKGGTNLPNCVKASRYWPTPALLRLAEDHGLTPQNMAASFRAPAPARIVTPPLPLELRPFRAQRWQFWQEAELPVLQHGRRRHGTDLPPEVQGLREDVEAQNALAAATVVTSPPETPCHHPQWYRVFSGSWRLQGRWYAQGSYGDPEVGHVSSYASLPAAQRALIRIDGAPVVELDARASHLTLLHGLLGVAMPDGVDADPYEGLGYPRPVSKQWVVEACGKGQPPSRWSKDRRNDFPRSAYRIKDVGERVLRCFPVLAQPAAVVPQEIVAEVGRPAPDLVTHYLAAREAAAMSLAMRLLRQQGILALPVHDSLIVPKHAEPLACRAITEGYLAVCGLSPRIKRK